MRAHFVPGLHSYLSEVPIPTNAYSVSTNSRLIRKTESQNQSIDWFWLRGWLNNKGTLCSLILELFWRKISVWAPSPLHILQIHSLHQVTTVTPSHVPLRCRGIIIANFRGSGTKCMVPSDWDMAPKCVFCPNFTSDLIGESPIYLLVRPNQSIMYVPLHVHRFQRSILLIVHHKYMKWCSGDLYSLKSDPPHKIMHYWCYYSI